MHFLRSDKVFKAAARMFHLEGRRQTHTGSEHPKGFFGGGRKRASLFETEPYKKRRLLHVLFADEVRPLLWPLRRKKPRAPTWVEMTGHLICRLVTRRE